MKIVICGSMHFSKEMISAAKKLKSLNIEPILPPSLAKYGKAAKDLKLNYNQLLKFRQEWHIEHFNKIKDSDAILVINGEKDRIKGYIGGAALSEIAYAFYLGKMIFFTNPVNESLPYVDELKSFEPVILENIEDMEKYI